MQRTRMKLRAVMVAGITFIWSCNSFGAVATHVNINNACRNGTAAGYNANHGSPSHFNGPRHTASATLDIPNFTPNYYCQGGGTLSTATITADENSGTIKGKTETVGGGRTANEGFNVNGVTFTSASARIFGEFTIKTPSSGATEVPAAIPVRVGVVGNFQRDIYPVAFQVTAGFSVNMLTSNNSTIPVINHTETVAKMGDLHNFILGPVEEGRIEYLETFNVPVVLDRPIHFSFGVSVSVIGEAQFDYSNTAGLFFDIPEGIDLEFENPGAFSQPNFLSAVPLPAPFLLLGSALVGVGLFKRCKE